MEKIMLLALAGIMALVTIPIHLMGEATEEGYKPIIKGIKAFFYDR